MRPYYLVFAILVFTCVQGLDQVLGQAPKPLGPADPSNPLLGLIAGEEFTSPSARAMQDDGFDNPAFASVEAGEQLWSRVDGPAIKSCKSCHGDPRQGPMRRVATTYPKYDAEQGRVITLSERVALCREKRAMGSPWSYYAPELTSTVAYLSSLSRGLPSAVDVTGPAAPTFEKGKALFTAKIGLLQFSCAQCHNDNYGHSFGAEIISQGHPQSYPVFKISDNRMLSLHDRFRLCNQFARAEQQAENSKDYVALELYLNWRSKNLPSRAPGVRP